MGIFDKFKKKLPPTQDTDPKYAICPSCVNLETRREGTLWRCRRIDLMERELGEKAALLQVEATFRAATTSSKGQVGYLSDDFELLVYGYTAACYS
jgi:hypothetical protein